MPERTGWRAFVQWLHVMAVTTAMGGTFFMGICSSRHCKSFVPTNGVGDGLAPTCAYECVFRESSTIHGVP